MVRLSSRLWSRCRPQGAPTTLASSELSPGSTVKPALPRRVQHPWGSSSELSTSRHGTHENTSSFLGATVNGCGVWGQHRGYARARWAWHCSHLCKGGAASTSFRAGARGKPGRVCSRVWSRGRLLVNATSTSDNKQGCTFSS